MKKMMSLLVAALVLSGSTSLTVNSVQAETYDIDSKHSSVGFGIRHLMVNTVRGNFNEFEGTFDYEPKDLKAWKVDAKIAAKSIDTGIDKRDDHLRNADFFDVEKYPEITFKSKAVTKDKEGTHWLKGDLTMHGVTKTVVLKLEPTGELNDPKMGRRVGFAASGKISRKDFGLTYGTVLESGGVALGDEVSILIEVSGVPKKK